jgi:hypothetical protein
MKHSTSGGWKALGRLFVLLAVLFGAALPAVVAHATDINSINSNDKRLLRWKYFNNPRAYPLANIPTGAYQRAVSYYEQKWGLQNRPFDKPNALDVSAWTPIGPAPIGTTPTTSGRINSIAIDPTNTNVIYLAAATGGVWKSTDGGASWVAKTDAQCSLAMGSVVLDPANPQIVYAGTGEQNFSADSFYGCGVLRSSDGGNTWTRLGGGIFSTATGGATIARVIVDPSGAGSLTASKVFAATSFGLYRSVDSGQTWTNTLNGIVTDLAMDPVNSSILYASVGATFGTAENGIYKSTNNGVTWTKLAGGLPAANLGRIELSVAPSSPSTIYAAIQNTANFQLLGIFKSTDSGATWAQLAATNASCNSQCWYDLHVTVSPASANTVFFGGVNLYKSTDGGASFDVIGLADGVHVDHHFFTFQPGTPSVTYAASDGGIWKSTDSGDSWVSLNANLSITQFYGGAALHPTDAGTVMGGTQDNGTLVTTGAIAWQQVIGGDGGYAAIDFNDPTTRYGETQWQPGQGFIGPRRSDAGGAFNQKLNGIDVNDRGEFIAPLVMSPSASQTLYFGTFRVYRTTNKGENWTAISPDLTTGGTITAIAQAKTTAQVIYVGASDGSLQVTQNGGTTWTASNAGLPNRTVKWIAVDPTNPAIAFVVFSGFGTGHVFKTTNSGTTWVNISSDLPDVPVNSIVLDPAAPTTKIYVGTDLGIMGTTNGGTSWTPFNNGMPNVPVFDLVFNQTTNTLVAATHGRGMFKATLGGGGGGTATLLSAVTPVARATAVNGTVTAFATILNTSANAGTGCRIALPVGAANINFSFSGRNPTTGAPENPNTPVTIPANGGYNFVMSFTPTATMSTNLALVFSCTNAAAAPSVVGLNTFLLTATAGAPSDLVSIAVTATNDGIANVPLGGTGFAALAAINIGTTANLQARLDANAIGVTGKTLAAALSMCQTNSTTGACLAPPSATVDFTLNNQQTVTFSAFITSNGTPITFDPANTRLFVHFFQGNDPVGSASVAVRTVAAAKPALAMAD